jgi:hypothetical protein
VPVEESIIRVDCEVKKLGKYEQLELEHQNKARKAAGLPLLSVKVKSCLGCGLRMETLSRRMCAKCRDERATSLSGIDVI